MSLSPKRKGRLTASVFGSAMGINPYQSRQALYRQMKGIDPPFEGNEATQYGTDNEPNAVDAYEINQGVIVSGSGDNQRFFIHPEHDWLGCTPDGYTSITDRLVEFKCPFGKMYKDIPAHYMAQIQGQMAITWAKECDFVAWSPDEIKIWRVGFNEDYWSLQFDLLSEFWGYINSDTEPKRLARKPKMPEVKYELIF